MRVVKGFQRNQILGKRETENNPGSLKDSPSFQKKLSDQELGELTKGFPEVEILKKINLRDPGEIPFRSS